MTGGAGEAGAVPGWTRLWLDGAAGLSLFADVGGPTGFPGTDIRYRYGEP